MPIEETYVFRFLQNLFFLAGLQIIFVFLIGNLYKEKDKSHIYRKAGKQVLLGKYLTIALAFILINPIPEKVNASLNYGNLSQQLNLLLKNEPDLNGAIIGVSVRSSSDGQLIYQHLGDTRLRPASNLKLFTAAAALAVLGAEQKSRTEVLMNGKLKGKTLKGNLYLRGKGDPTLLEADLNALAGEVSKKKIRKIDGDLIGDDTWYDHIRFSNDLPWSDETAYYGAPISALTVSPNKDFDQGTVIVEVTPGDKPGQKAKFKIIPKTNYVKIINKAITAAAEEKKSIVIKREHAKNIIMIEGKVPVSGKTTKEWIAVWEPAGYTLDLFKQVLNHHRIKVEGTLKVGKAPNHSGVLAYHDSLPLSERMLPFMKLSNNSHGEMMIKEMGKMKKDGGSWDKGMAVFKNELFKFGINPHTMVLRDGSGISHVNLIPANQITKLLFTIQDEQWFPQFKNSLPIAGIKEKMIGGTLRNRLKNVRGKVWAKTGTLSTVSSLSGYIQTKSGQQLIFSILINNLLDEDKGKKIEDEIVSILANH